MRHHDRPALPSNARRRALLAACLLTSTSVLVACGSGGASSSSGSGGSASGPVHIKVWGWYPDFKDIVANFNATHKDVQVDWTGNAVGQDEYTKLKTAIKAGSGAPDVVMLEFQELPTIALLKNSLLDMGKYGANSVKSDYVPWAWNQVSDGSSVYAIPVDAGPMAMLYRADLFQKDGLAVPTTWAQFAQEAEQLHAKDPSAYLADFGTNEDAAGWLQGLEWQAGSKPYTYSQANLPKLGLNLNDAGAKQVFSYWGDLIGKKAVDTTPFGTTDFYNGLSSGKYLTYIAAGWGPGYLASVAAKTSGEWRAAPLPQWTAGANAQSDWGGSAFSVTAQTQHPKEATEVAEGLFGTSQAAWKIGIDQAYLFPTVNSILNWSYFTDKQYPFFGNQKVNQVFVPASNGIGTFDWSPIQDFSYNTMTTDVGKALQGQLAWSQIPDTLQSQVSQYAGQQGFTVGG